MNKGIKDSDHIEIWMDGDCSVCSRSRSWCEDRDLEHRLRFTDFRTAADPEIPVSRHDLERSMWVRDNDGHLLEGFFAWRRIVGELPGWQWLALVTGLPPFRWFGPPVYRWIARNRHRLPVRPRRSGD